MTRLRLYVNDDGDHYSEPTLLRLFWAVIVHRTTHWLAGEGWRD